MDKKDLELYMKLPYQINIVPQRQDPDDSEIVYVATCPELSGLMSHGSTPEEARANLLDAKELYISTLLENGIDVPTPNTTSTAFSAETLIWTSEPMRQIPELEPVDVGTVTTRVQTDEQDKQPNWRLRGNIPTAA